MSQRGGRIPAKRGTKKLTTIVPPSLYRLLVHPYELRLQNMAALLPIRKKTPLRFSRNGTRRMSKPPKMICEIRFGSHLYGTATETSDEDFKGLFLPTAEEILLGRIPKTYHEGLRDDTRKNLPGEQDVEYYSLHHFLRLATQGQTVAIDMLFAPESMTFKSAENGWVWDRIVSNRKLLLSKQMNAFIGYARGQAAKYSLKGERLNKLRDFSNVLGGANARTGLTIAALWDKLPKDDERTNPQGIRELQIAGKWYGETTDIFVVFDSVNNMLFKYGKRAHAAADAAGIDWKALSHAVRVSKELLEILHFGEVQFPLRDAKLLLAIKRGEHSLEYVQDVLDRDLAFVELQAHHSTLPDSVDHKFWDDFLVDIMCQHLGNEMTRVLQ